MAEEGFFNEEALKDAVEGFKDFSARFGELAGEPQPEVESIIRFVRGIPGPDMAKKRELAKYFQSEGGQKYSKEERRQAYDDLLGHSRNRRTHG